MACFNNEGECGTGAVVPWADRLWVITYAPHAPKGSSDKLYEITPDLEQIVHPESIGGTPANRMIHKESNQLFIGSYAIDAQRNVRVIPFKDMYGRMTGNARHLTDPANKIYYATMEEGIYEVDVRSLVVTELWRDEQQKGGRHANLPGYHGKGLYSGQGRLIYANNGDHAAEATVNPAAPSGALAEWDGKADKWTVIRRNQFTDVTGPGGITGNPDPAKDPVWTIGWDYRSLIFMCLDHGKWTSYRLPKGSHSYDGAHGWNTEWPRIREIGGKDFLMTMHGTFWNFPATFDSTHSAGIKPLSNYLKVIGDFARWKDKVVFGCDDTAKAEFLNKNKAKGVIAAPQSQSNLWFVDPEKLADIGPVIGRGAVWMNEPVKRNAPSDPYLLSGYDKRGLHLSIDAGKPGLIPIINVEVDAAGNGQWKSVMKIKADKPYQWLDLSKLEGTWLRLTSDSDLAKVTAFFQYANEDTRKDLGDEIFGGLAKPSEVNVTGGVVRARADNARTLSLAAVSPQGDVGYYELDGELKLKRVDDAARWDHAKKQTAIPTGAVEVDAASVLYVDEKGARWRLPKGDPSFDQVGPLGDARVCREVSTERNLFNAGGIFYEQPANNAGGFAKARAVATHNLRIHDYCSYRGMFIMSGVAGGQGMDNPHIIRSDDGKAALWTGAIDDVWKLGKPRGKGGPWKDTNVKAGVPSDPYLMTGFDKKTFVVSTKTPATVRAQVDLTGTGNWVDYLTFKVDGRFQHDFPEAFQAYWIRFVSESDNVATAQLDYR
ncbi:hypothetical protein KBB96_03765 [Luteolibacter ambystomatis]|uniref:Uncharacterized protein n=1 Tax=Luteolibacter ambystomatis TaxID=2824561 RepID=A0A975PH03_9BACT|nr:hypothetical protein KBB96_03765 [Luteolibacter ambystomatis]